MSYIEFQDVKKIYKTGDLSIAAVDGMIIEAESDKTEKPI